MRLSKTQKIVYIALLIELEIVIGRFVGIMTPIASINFSFLPLAVNAIVFGPVCAAFSAAISNIIGSLLFPKGLITYFPGFTLSSALNGLTYGLLLYHKPKRLWRVSLACFITSILISMYLSTYWVYVITGKGFLAILLARSLQSIIAIPVKTIIIWTVAYRVVPLVWRYAIPETSSHKPFANMQ